MMALTHGVAHIIDLDEALQKGIALDDLTDDQLVVAVSFASRILEQSATEEDPTIGVGVMRIGYTLMHLVLDEALKRKNIPPAPRELVWRALKDIVHLIAEETSAKRR